MTTAPAAVDGVDRPSRGPGDDAVFIDAVVTQARPLLDSPAADADLVVALLADADADADVRGGGVAPVGRARVFALRGGRSDDATAVRDLAFALRQMDARRVVLVVRAGRGRRPRPVDRALCAGLRTQLCNAVEVVDLVVAGDERWESVRGLRRAAAPGPREIHSTERSAAEQPPRIRA